MANVDDDQETPPDRPRFRFSLRGLLGLVTIGCLIGGLCLWPIWSSDESIILLTWSLSLVLGEWVARRIDRSIWWPLAGSCLATAVAFYVLREQEYWATSTWSWGQYAWKVWRIWGILLLSIAIASAIVLSVVRSLPHVPATARRFADRVRSLTRPGWLAISIAAAGIACLAMYWGLGDGDWFPAFQARWSSSSIPQLQFCYGGNQFVTVDDAGQVTLWDSVSGRPVKRFRAESPDSEDQPNFHAVMLPGNQLALASGIDDSIAVYDLHEGKLRRRITDEEMRSHEVRELRSVKEGKQLLVVHRPRDYRLVHFSLWDHMNQRWLQHGSYNDVQAYLSGVSSSGRYFGVTTRIDLNRSRLTIIDFEALSVVWETELDGSGPVVFFDDDRMIANSTRVFAIDGHAVDELPGVVLGALPRSKRLVLVEFQSLVPKTLGSLVEDVPIMEHLRYLNRVRLVIAELNVPQPESKSCWFYGYGTTLNAAISPDGRRLVWCDDEGRLLLWDIPAAESSLQ